MKLIALKGRNGSGKFVKVDDVDFGYLNQFSWWFSKMGYAYGRIKKGGKILLMHRVIMNPSSSMEIDHINSDRLDNQRSNLREATRQEQLFNCKKRSNALTSIYRGVSLDRKRNLWLAQIRKKNTSGISKNIYLGAFKHELDAVLSYNRAAIDLFGEYAKINKILC